MKKLIMSFISGAILGGAIGMCAGAKVMYDRCSKGMKEVEGELNNILVELEAKKKEYKKDNEPNDLETTDTGIVAESIDIPTYHTPAFKSSVVYTIPFDDFETEPEFESEVLFYYPETDEVTDDKHIPIGKAKLKELIGEDALTHFDEYEEDPDCVRVKNDTLKTYYEILRYYTSP